MTLTTSSTYLVKKRSRVPAKLVQASEACGAVYHEFMQIL